MLELTKQERSDVCEAIALRLLELEGFVLSDEHTTSWKFSPRYQAAAYKASGILDVVIDFSRNKEVEDGIA